MAFSAARIALRGLLNRSVGRVTQRPSILSRQIKTLPVRPIFAAGLNINTFRSYSQDTSKSKWVTIIFMRADGTKIPRKGKVGQTLQELIGQDNPEFLGYGACDGTISCSTCHVILSKEDFARLPKPTDEEDDTLDLSPCITETSRLGCCIDITPDMDGMVVKLPSEVKDLRDI